MTNELAGNFYVIGVTAFFVVIGLYMLSNNDDGERGARRNISEFKSFGPHGPTYRVEGTLRQLEDGDLLMEVTLVETGERVEYRLSRIEKDPKAV